MVIDPFSDNCTVVTGSHNLGFRASHNNDENMVIIRGHRGLAEAYACHVLDLYDHYALRFLLKAHPEIFGRPLQPDDTWQERYIIGEGREVAGVAFLALGRNWRRRVLGHGVAAKDHAKQTGKEKGGQEGAHVRQKEAGEEEGREEDC